MRVIDPEHNWFWGQGYQDGLDGRRAMVPDETRHSFQRSDYFAGYAAGSEDHAAKPETRFVNCDVCKTEGVIERGHPSAPDPTSVEICPACHGDLVIEVEVEPITEEELP